MSAKPPSQVLEASEATELPLDSGRQLLVRPRVHEGAGGAESLEVRSPDGDVELRVLLTDDGPVLRFDGSCIELSATDLLKLECARFELDASESVAVRSGGGMTLDSVEEMRINVSDADFKVTSRIIWLN